MESTVYQEARALAGNLASTWTGGLQALERLAPTGVEASQSPWAVLNRLDPGSVEAVFSAPEARADLSRASADLHRYLTRETWFERATERDRRLEALRRGPVAYFCMEYGLASWLPIYSGGLGVLAGDFLKEASDMGLPLVAVGLLYRCGFFSQTLDETNYQREVEPRVDPADLPLERVTDAGGHPLLVTAPIGGREVSVAVWRLRVGRVSLYLLDTDVEENARSEDRAITASLYSGDEHTRIQQEIVLGIGGIRALRALGLEPSVCSMNEGHAAFLGVELLLEFLQHDDYSAALRRTRSRIIYTNHTVVPAGNDVFSLDLVSQYLGAYVEASKLGVHQLVGLGRSGAGDSFSMALLAFQLSGKANAVSRLHAQVIPREWPGYSVEAVTNGVHVPSWLGSHLRGLFDRYVCDWEADDPDWEKIRAIPDVELQRARDEQRREMIAYVNRSQSRAKLDPNALTLVWARRFAEYKRAWLLTEDLPRLSRLISDTKKPVQLVISGKAHPPDHAGKMILQHLLQRLHEDAAVAARAVFVEDYGLTVARHLTAGADVWLNTPRKPLEASGTSGMKSSDNGGIQVTVTDGWAAEVDWWGVGWGIEGRDDQSDAQQLYGALEDGVVPTFYDRDESGVARTWASMMKNTLIVTLSRYSARRMLLEYLDRLYLPLLEEQSAERTVGI